MASCARRIPMRLTRLQTRRFLNPSSIRQPLPFPGNWSASSGPMAAAKSNIMDAGALGSRRVEGFRTARRVDDGRHLQRHHDPQTGVPGVGRADFRTCWAGRSASGPICRTCRSSGCSTAAGSPLLHQQPEGPAQDMIDLFLGTDLGPRAYAIIGQGMISRIIGRNPDDLRVFLRRGDRRYPLQGRAQGKRRAPGSGHAREPDARRGHPSRTRQPDGKARSAGRGWRGATSR